MVSFMLWLLCPWENPWYPLNRGWLDPIAILVFGGEKNLFPKPGIAPWIIQYIANTIYDFKIYSFLPLKYNEVIVMCFVTLLICSANVRGPFE
jgi:hypothetical protein